MSLLEAYKKTFEELKKSSLEKARPRKEYDPLDRVPTKDLIPTLIEEARKQKLDFNDEAVQRNIAAKATEQHIKRNRLQNLPETTKEEFNKRHLAGVKRAVESGVRPLHEIHADRTRANLVRHMEGNVHKIQDPHVRMQYLHDVHKYQKFMNEDNWDAAEKVLNNMEKYFPKAAPTPKATPKTKTPKTLPIKQATPEIKQPPVPAPKINVKAVTDPEQLEAAKLKQAVRLGLKLEDVLEWQKNTGENLPDLLLQTDKNEHAKWVKSVLDTNRTAKIQAQQAGQLSSGAGASQKSPVTATTSKNKPATNAPTRTKNKKLETEVAKPKPVAAKPSKLHLQLAEAIHVTPEAVMHHDIAFPNEAFTEEHYKGLMSHKDPFERAIATDELFDTKLKKLTQLPKEEKAAFKKTHGFMYNKSSDLRPKPSPTSDQDSTLSFGG